MASCKTCAAPLPPHTGVCEYCGSHNAVDLAEIHEFTVNRPESDRVCPDCDIPLQTLDLKVEGKFYIERCERCFGLFFDPGELEALLDKSVSNVFTVDPRRIETLAREQPAGNLKITYRKCPVCRELMYRINFAHRSGVIVDQCKMHGMWLDSGELNRLLEWKKAGGQLLHESVMKERAQEKERRERLRAYLETGSSTSPDGLLSSPAPDTEINLIDTLAHVFGKLFR